MSNTPPPSRKEPEMPWPLTSSAPKANTGTSRSMSPFHPYSIPEALPGGLRVPQALTKILYLEPYYSLEPHYSLIGLDYLLPAPFLSCSPLPRHFSLSELAVKHTAPQETSESETCYQFCQLPKWQMAEAFSLLLEPRCLHLSSQDPRKMLLAREGGMDKKSVYGLAFRGPFMGLDV